MHILDISSAVESASFEGTHLGLKLMREGDRLMSDQVYMYQSRIALSHENSGRVIDNSEFHTQTGAANMGNARMYGNHVVAGKSFHVVSPITTG